MFVVKNIAIQKKAPKPFAYLRKPAIWICLFVFSFGQTHRIASADEEVAPVVQEETVTPVVSEGEIDSVQVDEQSEGEGEDVMIEEGVEIVETSADEIGGGDNVFSGEIISSGNDQDEIAGEQSVIVQEETIAEQNIIASGVPHILPVIEDIEKIVTEPFLPKDMIWLQEGELMIDETAVSAKFKKDTDLKIREIQFAERTIVTGEDAGVTIVIPEDTKIFAPVTEEEKVIGEAPVVEEVVTANETVSGEQNTEISTEQFIPESSLISSLENSTESIVAETIVPEIDPMEGQAPLESEEILIQEHPVKDVEGLDESEKIEKVYTFGFADQHLVFTKPVQMTISLPELADGEVVQLQVKHHGDTGFNMSGLSASAETSCDENGNADFSGDVIVVVKDHQAVFYTCGASEFTVGTISIAFNPAFNNTISTMVVEPDGGIIVGGTFTSASGLARNRIARITATGSVDTIFDPNMNNSVNAMVRTSDDGLVIAGSFTTGGANMAILRIAKVTATGLLLTGGQFTGNTNNIINAIDIQSDGNMIIGGTFTTINGQTRNRVGRITSSGFLDSTFTGNLNNSVNAIKIQSDGKTLIGGIFTTVSGVPMTGIVRVDATGYIDRSFTGNSSGVLAIDVQSDGKIIIGGNLTNVVGGARSFLARTTSTGLLDTTFSGTVNGAVNAIKVLNDGRIMVAGAFNIANSQNVGRVVIFFPDGTLDTTFVPLFNATITALTVDSLQNAVFLGGTFTVVDGVSKTRFARVGILPSTCLGLTGCALWLKADAGIEFGGGNGVSGWTTQAGQDGVAGQPTGSWQPQFITGGMNYNPSISFDGSGSAFVMPINFTDLDRTQYVVMRSRAASGTLTVTSVGVPLTSISCDRSFMMSGGKFTTYLGTERRFSTGIINDSIPKILGRKYGSGRIQTLSVQGKADGFGTTQRPTQVAEVNLQIGRAPIGCLSGASYSGDIAEIMSFSRALTTGEELVVGSYLGLKYGIALDQTVPTDYVVRSGNTTITLWSAASGGIYSFDIAGIARSDVMGLYQNRSKSTNNSGEISIYSTGGFGNNQGLVWAHQGGVTGSLVTGLAVSGYLSIARVWHFQEKQGDVGNIELSYYSGAIPTFGTGKLIMFVASGGGLLTGSDVEVYTGTLDDDMWKFSFNPTDNTVITFGYLKEGQPPYDIRVSSGIIKEQVPFGSFVANLTSLDPNQEDTVFTYAFDTGGCAGTLDNDKFTIIGSQIYTNYYFQDMTQHLANICVRSTDSGGLYATGFFTFAIDPFIPVGIVDTGYTSVPAGAVLALATQFDGSLLLGGTFTDVGGVARNRIARLSSTGLIDSTFDPNANGQVNSIIVQANSGILIAGAFTTVGGTSKTYIARLTVTGEVDPSFNVVANGTIGAIAEQPDGSIVIGGAFTTVGGLTRNHMARVSHTGLVDSGFNPNLSVVGTVSGMVVQPDGKIIFVGTFTTVGGVTRNNIARVTSTGLLDPDFSTGVVANAIVNTVLLEPDGSILFGGAFTSIAATARNFVARFSSTGLIDSLNLNIAGSAVSSIVRAPDGSLYVGGLFSSVKGAARANLAHVDYSGNLDTTFDVYVNNRIWAMVANGWSIDIGGIFTQINIAGDGAWIYPKQRLARVGIAPSTCGGFGGCSTWLRADTGIVLSAVGAGVSGWLSQAAYNGVSGVQNTQSLMPTYVTGAMNFNPVVRFISGTHLFMAKQMNGQDATQFTVFRNSYNTGVLTLVSNSNDASPTLCDRGLMLSGGRLMTLLSGQRVLSTVSVNNNAATLASWNYGTGFGQTLGLQGSGNTGGTAWRSLLTMGALTGDGLLIGNSNCTTARGAFSGDIAEIITFERSLTNTEMNMMNSYLALKYGITIDQTAAPVDYILTGDIIAWSAASGGAYNHDIAGIGRHDTSSLYQMKSQSANDRFDIIVESTGSFANNETLVWANDGQTTAGFLVTGTIIDGYLRTPRTWRFQERNGDVGTVEISYYSGALQNFGDGTLYMFVSSGDNSFTGDGTQVYTGVLMDGNRWVFALNPEDDTTITFGYLNGNHRPYALQTSTLAIKEQLPIGSVAALLSTQDPNEEDSIFTYSFDTTCAGSLDNSKFTITGEQLLTNYYFQDMSDHIANVCLRTTDSGGLYLTGLYTFFIQPFVPLGVVDEVVPHVFGGPVYALALDKKGGIVIGGVYVQIVASVRYNLARLTATGLVDQDFNPHPNGQVNAVIAQSNGGFVVGGEFDRMSGTDIVRNYIARLTETGQLDTEFTGLFMNANVSALLEQGDKIIAGGSFSSVNGVALRGIARLTSTGELDTTFTGLFNSTGSVSGLALQPDGNILVGGRFTTVGGQIRTSIARVTSTGLLDPTFTGANANNGVEAIAVQSDGSIVMGGAFTTVGGAVRNRIARVSSTGLLDTTFDPNINGVVKTILIDQTDGSILVGGVFTLVQGVARWNFARLSSGGKVDTTFDVYAQSGVYAMISDGRSVDIGGAFTSFGSISSPWSVSKQRFARIGLAPSVCGGFGGCSTWLRADTGIVLSAAGAGVSGWLSQTVYNGVSGVQNNQSLMPTYVTGAMNFNPVVRFLSGDYLFMAKQMNGQDATQFTVFRNSYNTGVLTVVGNTTDVNPTLCDRGLMLSGGRLMTLLSGQRVLSTVSVNNNAATLASWNYGTGFGQTLGLQGSGNTGGTAWRGALNMGSQTGAGLLIGNSNCTTARGAFSGDIAEIITFERRLSDTEMNMMNSYLALKYGITIDQTAAPVDYILTGDIIAWSAASGGAYNRDIAGIGRHDSSSLLQQKSRSENSRSDIIVEFTGGSFANNALLVWANDGESTGNWVTDNITTGYKRIERTWYFQERNNDIDFITITIDSGSIAPLTGSTLYMAVRTGGDMLMSSMTQNHTGTLVGDTWQFVIPAQDDLYMTFAYQGNNTPPTDLALTPLTMNEKLTTGASVGTFTTTDAEDSSFTYTFDTTCAGTLDNDKFTISDDELLTNYYFQYAIETSARVCIQTMDSAGHTLTGVFTIDILPTTLSMAAPASLLFTGLWRPAFNVQTFEQNFSNDETKYFKVADGVGADAGYTTTLQLDGNLTSGSSTISASNVYFKSSATEVDTIAGSANPRVEIDTAALSYQPLDHATNFILRDTAANSSVMGVYGAYIWMQVALPAEQPIGQYQGTLVYTLIEN